MVFKVLIVMSSFLLLAKMTSSTTVNYVKPFAASSCSDVQRSCLTLNEYASDSKVYFVNNTIFYFYPGIHRLDGRLILENLYNLSLRGWPHGDQVVSIRAGSLTGISLNGSCNIEISSISFVLYDNFTFVVKFEYSESVRLSNISIYGNGYHGCSSIISKESALDFDNARFIGIKGFLGAAVMMLSSNITFRGNNLFAGNTAYSGGSIYLANSELNLNGASRFLNNTSESVHFSQVVIQWNSDITYIKIYVENKTDESWYS